VTVALASSSLYSIGKLGGQLDFASNYTPKKIALIGEIQSNIYKMRSCQRGVMMFAMYNLPAKVKSNKEEFESRAASVGQMLADVQPMLVTELGRNSVAAMQTELPNFEAYFEQVAGAAAAGDAAGALSIYNDHSSKALDIVEKAADAVVASNKQAIAQATTVGAQSVTAAWWITSILLILILVMGPIALLMLRNTSKQLRSLASDLAEGAEQIISASSQVASSSQGLAQGASEQAASLEETSASSEEITSMTRKNAENSQTAAGMMSEVDRNITQGNQTLGQMVTSMREITSSSDKISKIIKVIDEIAFQTNILALNAAVEAARAGEAGMGFAVVADEVRNLAQRSAQAAKDTAALIEESIAKSNEGSAKLQQVTVVIQAVTESATKVKTLVDDVSLGSQEQTRGIEQISKAISQMDQVTQGTAANAEQSASASEEMSAQAEALNHIVVQLRSLVGSDETQPGKTLPPARQRASKRIAGSLSSLRSAVNRNAREPVEAAVPAGDHPAIPMDDNFTEM
jgi:methyl-accepting chemotaxis protein/methyl-accepting chemotaxis protein-1 (serine sensor receptor)